ncbi:MAG: Co2+/Mg2+ efflux protein ApaG [Lewinella sp.]|nr:Co2+/Mg2+ efflux protein ApaG [Lewinella sp.]
MPTLITQDIKIMVQARYEPAHSMPVQQQYIFSYRVKIENLGRETVQLLRRHWVITDGLGHVREVEGDGVIGQQPVIAPGEQHQYDSWSPLATPLGHMEGAYLMRSVDTQATFQVRIPRFELQASTIDN